MRRGERQRTLNRLMWLAAVGSVGLTLLGVHMAGAGARASGAPVFQDAEQDSLPVLRPEHIRGLVLLSPVRSQGQDSTFCDSAREACRYYPRKDDGRG